MNTINGARILLECLKRAGVSDMFGYPGGAVIPLYDEIYDFEGITHYHVRHEQGAAHAADAYARATGKLGVCLATSGPGATNLVTGIMTAHMDSVPMLAITGQVSLSVLGRDAFQESDVVGITMPITKHNYLVKDIKDLPKIVREAIHLATTGRPGPVLIDIPKNIQIETIAYSEFEALYKEELNMKSYQPKYFGHPRQIKMAAKAIAEAKKPVIIAGSGVIKSQASELLQELAEKAQIPVTMTLLGLGSIPNLHYLSLEMLGMHGTTYANYAVNEADLVIGIGMRFDDRITGDTSKFCPNARVIHIDIDPAEISKNINADIPIVGDVKNVLIELLKDVKAKKNPEWMEIINKWKNDYALEYNRVDGQIKPQQAIEAISKITEGNAVIITDVGQHQMWTAQYYKFNKAGNFCSSGGAGTMGFGVPAGFGAQIARPNDKVISIVGDGGFQMTSQELMTIMQYKAPVKTIILNNGFLGMVRQWQEIFHKKRYSSVDLSMNPDFIKLGEAYGMNSVKITHPDELYTKLKDAILNDEPALIEIVITKDDNVFPMIPAGKSVEDLIGKKGEL